VLGVLGLGNVGGQVARVGRAFGMTIIAWSQNMTPAIAEAAGATLVTKDELFRQADVVTVHLILSRRTRGLIGAAELALMKTTACLVNTSRGSRAIAGAALDVFDVEPLPANHLFRVLDNVLATPHTGYVGKISIARSMVMRLRQSARGSTRLLKRERADGRRPGRRHHRVSRTFVIRAGKRLPIHLITGQNPASSAAAAQELIELLRPNAQSPAARDSDQKRSTWSTASANAFGSS